jgi:putative aminopeptidase FrvX
MSKADSSGMAERVRQLLDILLVTHAPPGREEEMNEACRPLLEPFSQQIRQDSQGNIIAQLCQGSGPSLGIFVHKDEIAAMVCRIHDDGKMELEPLGGSCPWAFGEGPWEVLGKEPVLGYLGVGSRHVSHLSGDINALKSNKALTWPDVRLDCKLKREELAERGVTVGCPACVARIRKQPVYVGDFVGGYALDDKAGVAAAVLAAELLHEAGAGDANVYLVLTGMEELGTIGAMYVPRDLRLDAVLAIETFPVAPEYPIEMGPTPVVVFKDSFSIYSPRMSHILAQIAERVVGSVQRSVARSYGTDAGGILKSGLAPSAAVIGFPTENTHGFEVAHLGAVVNCARVTAEFAATFSEVFSDD